ncbi:AMP-binding protein [Micromonospora sp. M42]|uniref:AMP-binding protein n=1 Tax=Micromonospora sp. M42 TaxID=457406 RepID=UPI00210092D4|nr:AMP-binding protein [Micromonospora sp. M42]
MLGALLAGAPLVPLPPGADERERRRILRQSGATVILGRAPSGADGLSTIPVDLREHASTRHPEPAPGSDAVILYTGGASGPPRGVRISRRAIAADLDLLARAWHWSEEDVVVQGTPLFRAYGLVVGLLGALRAGSRFVHLDHAGTGPVGSVHLASPDQWGEDSAGRPPGPAAVRGADPRFRGRPAGPRRGRTAPTAHLAPAGAGLRHHRDARRADRAPRRPYGAGRCRHPPCPASRRACWTARTGRCRPTASRRAS